MPSRGRCGAHACGLGMTGGLHTAAVIRARHAEQDQHHRVDNIVLICCVLHDTPRRISMWPQLTHTSGAVAQFAIALKAHELTSFLGMALIVHYLILSLPDRQGLCSVSGLQPHYQSPVGAGCQGQQ